MHDTVDLGRISVGPPHPTLLAQAERLIDQYLHGGTDAALQQANDVFAQATATETRLAWVRVVAAWP